MIRHVSIPARDQQHVAEGLAELMNGKSFPFGPLEGAFMAASGDANGTMIEVYPERATLDIPDRDHQVVFADRGTSVAAARPALGVARDFSLLGRMVRAVAAWRARARADAEARRSMFCLAELDDHTLSDIGLNRAGFYHEGMRLRRYDI
jgi:uncharacterized protein YjiS (DUF1127 family)